MSAESRGAQQYLPDTFTRAHLREAAQGCRGCDLYRLATQAVLGEFATTTSQTSNADIIMIEE